MRPDTRDPETPERAAVIGAGPAGLAAAYTLAGLELPVEVFEAAPVVGGMAKTLELWDQKVDLGPHRFFSADVRANRLWLEVVGTDYRMVDRLTRIYYDGKFSATRSVCPTPRASSVQLKRHAVFSVI